ncbi:MAG TPA: DinB family protein [Deinococcales bacterium]|nr:DinB family protein [Deinococcales bacterium]
MTTTTAAVLTPEMLFEHLAGHRRLTRRVIEAFPDDKLFTFTPAPPMRTFGALAIEMIGMVVPTLEGLASGQWDSDFSGMGVGDAKPTDKAGLLQAWDKTTQYIDQVAPRIAPERFLAVESAFGLPAQPGYDLFWYLMDNEIHHRGQGYVYLRALGIEPPFFWER